MFELGCAMIKGALDKSDVLIQEQIEEIPLSGHEGAPCGSSLRGGCHYNSRTSVVDLASEGKGVMTSRDSCF